MPTHTEADEALYQQWVHADDKPSRDELAREVLDGPELANYFAAKEAGRR